MAAMLARVGANAHGDVAESPSPPPTQQSPTQDPNVEAARASAQAAMTAFGEAPTALNAKSAPAPPSPAVRRAPPRQQTAPPQGQPHPKFPPPPPNDEGPPPPPPAAGRTPFAQQSPQVSTKADDDDYIEVGHRSVVCAPPPSIRLSLTAWLSPIRSVRQWSPTRAHHRQKILLRRLRMCRPRHQQAGKIRI